jgi:hypothetical protein
MEVTPAIQEFIRRSRLQRAAVLLERKLEVAKMRKQKSISVPLEDVEAIVNALRGCHECSKVR